MKEYSMRAWTGPAITAKLFVPITLAIISGLIAVPIRDVFTAAWFFLVVLPVAGTAVWLFSNIGEIRPSANGVLYRKWVTWHHINSTQISNVVRVFPCFAALVLDKHVKLFFFPDSDTRRVLRSLSAAVHNDEMTPTAEPAKIPRTSLLRAMISLLMGAASGIAIWAFRGSAAWFDTKSMALVLFVNRYLPLFVNVSLVYLTALAIGKRLKPSELHVSLALIGLGIVYLSAGVFHAF